MACQHRNMRSFQLILKFSFLVIFLANLAYNDLQRGCSQCPGVKQKGLLTGEETGVVETYKFLAKLCLDWLLSFTKKSLVKFLRNVLKEFSRIL